MRSSLLFILLILASASPVSAERHLFEFSDGKGDLFVVQIQNPGMARKARRMISRKIPNMIIAGKISKTNVSYNSKWSYHMVPKTIIFGEFFIEVCDAAISYLEKNLSEAGGAFLPGGWWCPWSSKIRRELRG